MEKQKRSKKYYAFKEKHKERDKLKYKRGVAAKARYEYARMKFTFRTHEAYQPKLILKFYPEYSMNTAPADYVRPYNVKFRRKCKQILKLAYLKDEDPIFPIPGRHTAVWDSWKTYCCLGLLVKIMF